MMHLNRLKTEELISFVLSQFKADEKYLTIKSRDKKLVKIKRYINYYLRKRYGYKLKQIEMHFKDHYKNIEGFDHSNIYAACNVMENDWGYADRLVEYRRITKALVDLELKKFSPISNVVYVRYFRKGKDGIAPMFVPLPDPVIPLIIGKETSQFLSIGTGANPYICQNEIAKDNHRYISVCMHTGTILGNGINLEASIQNANMRIEEVIGFSQALDNRCADVVIHGFTPRYIISNEQG